MATTTFVPTESMIRETYEAFTASTAAVKDVPGMRWIINLEPLPQHIYSRGAADNCLGLATRTKPLVVCLLCPAWLATDEDHDEQVDAAARALIADIEARAKKLDVYDSYVYMGYAAPWQDVIASYGEESVGKLKELRARVDSQEVFTRLVPGGFKIPA